MASRAKQFEEEQRKRAEEADNAKNAELEAFKAQRAADMKAKREAKEQEDEVSWG